MGRRVHEVRLYRAAGMGITAMELVSNHGFPRHSHDEYGIGVVLSGAQRSWSGMGMVESIPGDVITVNPGELHDGHPIGGAIRQWRIIYFDPTALTRQLLSDEARQTEFSSPSLRNPCLSRAVNALFDRLAEGADHLGIEELVAHIVKRLSLQGRSAEWSPKSYSDPVSKARARIDEDPSRPTTLAELATLSGLNRYQIVRAFARELGTTPYAYILQRRVLMARDLLLRGEDLATTAQRSGFSDQSHMTRAFTRQFGVSPGRYAAAHD
jgi:AraC-like DNA-binding protein